MRLNDYLIIVDREGKDHIQRRCGYLICDANKNFKEHALLIESSLKKIGPLADMSAKAAQFVFREFCCPNCATLLSTEFALKGENILYDIELKPTPTGGR